MYKWVAGKNYSLVDGRRCLITVRYDSEGVWSASCACGCLCKRVYWFHDRDGRRASLWTTILCLVTWGMKLPEGQQEADLSVVVSGSKLPARRVRSSIQAPFPYIHSKSSWRQDMVRIGLRRASWMIVLVLPQSTFLSLHAPNTTIVPSQPDSPTISI